MWRWNGTIASKMDPHQIGTGTKSDRISIGMEPEANFSKKTKCDVKIMTNTIWQSDKPKLRQRRKNFLQQCRRYGSDVTEWCDDVREEILEPTNEYQNHLNDVTERLEPGRMLTRNPSNRGAAGRRKNGGLTNGWFAPKLRSVRWRIGSEWGCKKTRNPQEQQGGKCRINRDAAAYGKMRGNNTQSQNQEVPDCASSKCLAPANGTSAGLKKGGPAAQTIKFGGKISHTTVAWLGVRVANDAASDVEDFQNA